MYAMVVTHHGDDEGRQSHSENPLDDMRQLFIEAYHDLCLKTYPERSTDEIERAAGEIIDEVYQKYRVSTIHASQVALDNLAHMLCHQMELDADPDLSRRVYRRVDALIAPLQPHITLL